jgi:tetratricopeptide (TPR) repeat protein
LVSAFEQSPFAPEVMEPLAALCDAHEAWPNLLQAYETLAASQPDWEVRLRLEMADISERMGEPTMAIAQHVMAWKRDSDDDSAWLALQARAERLGHLKDAAKAGTWKLTQNLDHEAMAKWSIRTQRAALRAELPDRASAALFAHSASSLPTADWFDEACEVWRESHPLDGFDWAMQTGEQVPEARLLAFDAAAALATTPIQMAMAAKARLDAAPTDEHRQAWIDALLAAERFVEARDAWVAWAAERSGPEGIRDALLAAHALDQQIGELPSVSADRLAEAALRDTADDALFDAWLESARAAERWPAVAAALIGRESKQDAPQTWLQASKVFEESLGDPGRALDAIRTGLDHLPDDRDLAARRAELLAVLERWAEHVAALEALAELAEASQAGQLLSQAAEAAELQLTDTRRALELLEAASRRDPDRSTPWLEQARLHASLGATDDSAACLREGIARLREEQSTSPNPRRLAAVLTQLAELSDDAEALPLLREARELDPTAPAPRIALFAALRRSGDTDGVLAVIDEALRDATPEDAAALLLERANVLLHDAKRPTDAARTLERVRAQVGDTPGVHAITGDFHLLAERWDDAFQAYRSALGASENLAPNEVPAPRATLPNERVDRSSVTAIYLGRAAVSAENAGLTREAQELFAAANLEDERDPVALLGLARLAVKRGAAEAARIYLADLEAGPDGEADDVRDAIDALMQRAGL